MPAMPEITEEEWAEYVALKGAGSPPSDAPVIIEAPDPPSPAEVQAQAEATATVIEAQADADVRIIEAQAQAQASVIEAEAKAGSDDDDAFDPFDSDAHPEAEHPWFRKFGKRK